MRCHDQRGSATVWALAWLGLLALVAQLALLLTAVVARQHHVDAAADMSALSAAQRLQRGDAPCPVAAAVAEAHEAKLTDCRVEGEDVSVDVVARIGLPLGLSIDLRGVARAGP